MVVVVMGVSGAGKTLVGRALAARLGWRFLEGDDFHPPANVDKMRRGEPLTDEDRAPWLTRLRDEIVGCLERGQDAVLACSALKRAYRSRLRVDAERVRFVYLHAERHVLRERLEGRPEHFMPAALLASQLDTLEEPEPRDALRLDATRPVDELVERIRRVLAVSPRRS